MNAPPAPRHTPRSVGGPSAKGAVLRATHDFVAREAGFEALDRLMARLAPEERRRIELAAPTDEIPFGLVRALWGAVDAELGAADPGWIERSGAHSIESLGVQLYGGILKKRSPDEFLTQSVSLFRLFYQPGDMHVVEAEPGRAVLRLVGFDHDEPLFCRRQTGGLARALAIAGGESPSATHVRCAVEGDAFCEWELRWR